MGSVGSIEKFMVGGILFIMILILVVAIKGGTDSPIELNPVVGQDANEALAKGESGNQATLRNRDDLLGNDGNRSREGTAMKSNEPRHEEGGMRDDETDPSFRNLTAPPPVVRPPIPVIDPTPIVQTYTIKPGDTLSRIAVQELGSIDRLEDLQKANEELDPKKLRVGQVINLPFDLDVDDLQAEAEETVNPTRAGAKSYTVVAGDNLSKISRKFYGTTGKWKEILAANLKLAKPTDIRPGMVLVIP